MKSMPEHMKDWGSMVQWPLLSGITGITGPKHSKVHAIKMPTATSGDRRQSRRC